MNGISLLGISLNEIHKADIFKSVWVSTDHEDIAKEALKCKFNSLMLWKNQTNALFTKNVALPRACADYFASK